jgi:hypothetical protein
VWYFALSLYRNKMVKGFKKKIHFLFQWTMNSFITNCGSAISLNNVSMSTSCICYLPPIVLEWYRMVHTPWETQFPLSCWAPRSLSPWLLSLSHLLLPPSSKPLVVYRWTTRMQLLRYQSCYYTLVLPYILANPPFPNNIIHSLLWCDLV